MEKTFSRVFGVVLLLLGLIGFFSNSLISSTGYFYVNAGMNIVNLLAGIILLSASGNELRSAVTLRTLGLIYFTIAIIGFALLAGSGTSAVLGFMGVNMSASWLYAVLGVLMFASGYAESKQTLTLHERRSHA